MDGGINNIPIAFLKKRGDNNVERDLKHQIIFIAPAPTSTGKKKAKVILTLHLIDHLIQKYGLHSFKMKFVDRGGV